VGHGKEGVAAAAAADWQRQQAAATPPASSAAAAAATPSALLPHLRQLSEEQLAAVTAPLGTVRVVAGPGSGKTRVLTARIVQLIHVHKAQPWQILAITFTNKVGGQLVAWRHPHSWYRVSFR
jgi:superfamily I DNA and RNA helicase